MCAGRRRDVAVSVTIQLIATERILVPDLEVNFRPPCMLQNTSCKNTVENAVQKLRANSATIYHISGALINYRQ